VSLLQQIKQHLAPEASLVAHAAAVLGLASLLGSGVLFDLMEYLKGHGQGLNGSPRARQRRGLEALARDRQDVGNLGGAGFYEDLSKQSD
jgi:hypothetical protein